MVRSRGKTMGKAMGRAIKGFLAENTLDPLPLRRAFTHYTKRGLRADARAGLNVALVAFPQGMAYAVIAGLPIQFGIYCSAIAALVAPLFASSRHTILGPTNATAVMIMTSYPYIDHVGTMPLFVLLVGLLLVIGAALRMANMIQYISYSVLIGYISGAALLIMANQLKHVLQIDLDLEATRTTFFQVLEATFRKLPETHWPALALGVVTFGLWWLLSRKLPSLPNFAISLVLASFLGVGMESLGYPVATFSSLPIGSWPLTPPELDMDAFSQLFTVAVAVAFLASLENSVMSKTLANRTGDRPDVNQDMFSVGIANVTSSFLGGMPASGSLTRSALNFASGAVSPLSSILCGLLCAVGAVTLGPLIGYVPKTSLAVLVIGIALSLIHKKNIRIALRSTRSDATVLVVTFLGTLVLALHEAIFVGVAISIVLYLRKASRPELIEYDFNPEGQLTEREEKSERSMPQISIVHVEGELFFGAAELFREQILRTCNDPSLRIIILRMKNARHLDATSVIALEELLDSLRRNGRHLIISGASRSVYRVLRNSGFIETLGKDNFFMASVHNPNLSTRNALKRAQELLGTKEAEIKIYFDPKKGASQ